MFWLVNLVYFVAIAVVLAIYRRAVMTDRALIEDFSRIDRLKLSLSLLLIEIKLVMESPRDGQRLDLVELKLMEKSVQRMIRRIKYTCQYLIPDL